MTGVLKTQREQTLVSPKKKQDFGFPASLSQNLVLRGHASPVDPAGVSYSYLVFMVEPTFLGKKNVEIRMKGGCESVFQDIAPEKVQHHHCDILYCTWFLTTPELVQ